MSNNANLVNQDSGVVEYYTPPSIIEAARKTMNWIDFDPASSVEANKIVKAKSFETQNGLEIEWHGRVWMNHPFSRDENKLWIAKLISEFESGRVRQACCITYASTSEAWFSPLLHRPQCFLIPRTNYLLPNGEIKRGVTKGSVVTYFGSRADRFKKHFNHLGIVKI